MKIQSIRGAGEHESASRLIEQLWGAEEGSDPGNLLEAMVAVGEVYELENCSAPLISSRER